LQLASANGHVGAVRVLLEAGAAVDSKTGAGTTALMQAGANGDERTITLLLWAWAAVDLKDNYGRTVLMGASANGHDGAVRVLLEAGAAVDLIDKRAMTALMYASEEGCEAAVRVLLEAGAAVDVKDNIGRKALAIAIHKDHLDAARLLLEAGADPPPSKMILGPNPVKMQQLLALHRDERQTRAAEAGREAAEAAAEAAADALLAEEEAEKLSAESRQAKAKLKKQRQKTKRAETVPGPAQAEGAGSGPPPSGPGQYSDSQTAAGETGADFAEGPRTALEQGPEPALSVVEERDACAAEEEERGAALAAPHEPPQVVTVPAEEVLRALEAAGSDGEVGEGGFGKVFAAELPSLAARWGRVAVKCASGVQAADILLEVATLRLCSHRNVLLLLGYCDDARAPCMITPLMHGGSLDDRLLLSDGALERLRRLGVKGDARLNWQRRMSALCDAARGLAHLHGECILHRDVKTANILLEGALRPLPMAHGLPLLVHRAVLSDVGLAKVREPTLGGGTMHATTRNLAFSMGFGDPALTNSNQHSERTDAFGIGICILMSLVGEPAAGLMNDQEDDVCEAMEGEGALFGTAHAVAGWPSDATRALAALVYGLSMTTKKKRQPLAEALVQMEALLGTVGEAAGGEESKAQPAPVVVGAASAVSRPRVCRARGRAGRSCCGFGTAGGVVRWRANADGAKARAGGRRRVTRSEARARDQGV